ncbi:MAG TPA: hypothetical protein VF222_10855 [Nitrososphaeraceae archaeon]
MTDRDYYLDMAINAAIEYVKKKEGIELEGKDRLRYKSIIIDDEEFHVFAFFKYGLIIDYDNNTDELVVNELDGVKSGKYTKGDLAFLKSSIDRFGSLEEFQKSYKEFKQEHSADTIKDIQEINKEFRKEFGIPDRMAIPGDLDNLIDQ